MGTSTNLQKAQIVKVTADRILVKHPDLANYLRTRLTAAIAAAGTAATVLDNDGIAQNEYVVVGYPGISKSEEVKINAAVTRGAALTFENTLKFAHGIDSPVTRIKERKIRIKGADTLTGSQTEITGSPFTIQWDKDFTECVNTGEDYAFYFAEYSDAAVAPVYGTQSDGVAQSDIDATGIEQIIQDALGLTGESISTKFPREWFLRQLNLWRQDVARRREWSFELTEGNLTSDIGENSYALSSLSTLAKYTASRRAIKAVTFKGIPLDPYDYLDYLELDRKSVV